METTIMRYIGNMVYIVGVILSRVNGEENGSYYSVIGLGRGRNSVGEGLFRSGKVVWGGGAGYGV